MRRSRKPTIVFLTGAWSNIDDRIRRREALGGVSSVWMIWKQCLEHGFDVHVFILTELEPGWAEDTVELGGVHFHWIRPVLAWLTQRLSRSGVHGILTPHWLLGQVKMLCRVLRSGVRPDIVYSMRHAYGAVAWLLTRRTGARFVLRNYGVAGAYEARFVQKKWLDRLKALGALVGAGLSADLQIMTNDGTRGDKMARRARYDMRKFRHWINGVNKSMRIPGFDRRAFRRGLGLPPETPLLLAVGRLATWKRQDRIVDAMPQILAEFPHARLFLIGEGTCREALEGRARRLDVSEAVTFVGAVGHDQVRQYLNATDLFLQTSDISNLSNSLLEALATGCCVITRDVGGTTDVVTDGNNAVVLRPGEAADYAEAVVRLLKNPEEQKRLAETAHKSAMKDLQSWDERMEMEVDELKSLIATPL